MDNTAQKVQQLFTQVLFTGSKLMNAPNVSVIHSRSKVLTTTQSK